MWIRKPKIIIAIDDMSGSSLFVNITKNRFYKLITKRRHLNIWSIMIAVHGVSIVYSNFKSLMTGILLYVGLK